MLHVRSIHPGQGIVESASFDLTPSNPQGEAVCSLIERFLVNRPPAFQDRLSFLKKGDFALDWSAVTGGVALASLFQGGEPASMSVLLAGLCADTDSMMLEVFRENVLEPLFGCEFNHVCTVDCRPLLVQVVFPCSPEWVPATQLLSVSFASVYFRTILSGCGSGGCDGG